MQEYAIHHYSKLENPIVEAKFCDEKIFVIDIKNILYIFNSSFELTKKTKLSKKSTEQHFYSNAFSIAKSAVSVPIEKKLFFVECKEEIKAKHSCDLHQSPIVFTSHCTSSRYLLSASEDGRAYLHDTQTKTPRYIFSNKPDYCSYATISQKNRFAYVGYYNCENILFSLQNDKTVVFETKYPIELALFFDNEKKLFLADREGNSIIYDCIEQTILEQKVLFTQWASCVVLSPNKKYLIVATRTEKIYLVDPYKNELVETLSLVDSGVTSMDIDADTLLLSCTNGTLLTIDLAHEKEQFLIHLNLKEYAKAKEILDTNAFLILDDAIEKFRNGFDEVLIKAKEYITKNMLDEALDIVAPFMGYKEYKEKLDQLFMQQDHIASFLEAVEKKDISGAYAIAHKYPLIASLNLYMALEKQWELAFAKARKALEEDPLYGERKAREILALYETIPQKTDLVRRLLSNKTLFVKADDAIKKQDFVYYFKLCNEYSFLKETSLYKKVETLGYTLQRKALEYCKDGSYERAKDTLRTLLCFPLHKRYALQEIKKMEQIERFIHYVEEGKKGEAYAMATKSTYLSFLDAFEKLNKPFEEKMQKAFAYAKSADIRSILRELREYLEIKDLYNKIDSCMKIAYLKQLEECIFTEINKEVVLKKYYSLFGLDDLIEALFIKKGFADLYLQFTQAPKRIEVYRYEEKIFEKLG